MSVDDIGIHWPLDNAYYAGHVASVSVAGLHFVRDDDSESEMLDLSEKT